MSQLKTLLGLRCNCSNIAKPTVPSFGHVRFFRAETPDAEARDDSETGTPGPACAGAPGPSGRKHSSAGTDSRPQGVSGGEGQQRPQPSRREPIRSTQPLSPLQERRKVLAPGAEEFLGNVATLLVRWPHAPLQKAPRSWREVLENGRFQYLFPRRPQPLSQQAVKAFEALAHAAEAASAGGEPGRGDDAISPLPPSAAGAGLSDAQQAALMELMERLGAVQQHLQDNDDGSSNSTIITVATFTEDELGSGGGDGDEDSDAATHSASGHSTAADEERRHGHAYAHAAASSPDSSGGARLRNEGSNRGTSSQEGARAKWDSPLGRRQRTPVGRQQRSRRPAPPWDDTQPFQTHVGTVYHFWRLCPYG